MTPQQLKKELLKYDNQFLAELIMEAINRKREFKTAILEKLNEKTSAKSLVLNVEEDAHEQKVKLNGELLSAYWKDARKIVAKSNKYGGCPDSDMNKAGQLLLKMDKFLQKEVVSDTLRNEILKEAIVEHEIGNSGFDDALMDVMHSLCIYKQDWEYLVKYLENKRSGFGSYYKGLARQIRKDKLQDDEGFLKSAQAHLKYGMDYHELGMFYAEKNDITQAVATMEQGLIKGEGRLNELFDYLFAYYAPQKNDAAIDRLIQTAHNRKTYLSEIADKAFGYYQSTNYEKATKALLDQFEHVSGLNSTAYLQLYKKAKAFLTESDWKTREPVLLALIAKLRPIEHLEILLYKGEKKQVLQLLNSGKVREDWLDKNRLDKIGIQIQDDFPEEMIAYYWQKASQLIDLNGRENYAKAVSYLKEAKHLYAQSLHQPKVFSERINSLRGIHQKKRAFLEESAVLL